MDGTRSLSLTHITGCGTSQAYSYIHEGHIIAMATLILNLLKTKGTTSEESIYKLRDIV